MHGAHCTVSNVTHFSLYIMCTTPEVPLTAVAKTVWAAHYLNWQTPFAMEAISDV